MFAPEQEKEEITAIIRVCSVDDDKLVYGFELEFPDDSPEMDVGVLEVLVDAMEEAVNKIKKVIEVA